MKLAALLLKEQLVLVLATANTRLTDEVPCSALRNLVTTSWNL
jgi:hypothetical protein